MPTPKCREDLNIALTGDSSRALSIISLRIVIVHDIILCYMCKIGYIGDLQFRIAYEKLCENGRLKDEHKVVAERGLTLALNFLKVFMVKWIKVVLR